MSFDTEDKLKLKNMMDGKFCKECTFWGDEWISRLGRECSCMKNKKKGYIFTTGAFATCEHWKSRIAGALDAIAYKTQPPIENIETWS